MQKWDYRIVTHGLDEELETLNQLGEEGWELVDVDRIQGVAEKTAYIPDENLADKWVAEISMTTVRFYLKRPKE